jgi:prophage regulatory protein
MTPVVRVIARKDLRAAKGIPYTVSHIDQLEKKGLFPRRIHLGPRRVVWLESEIDAWLAEKVAGRDA